MKIYPTVTKITDFLFDKCSKDIGSVLIWTTIAGWIASSAAQIIGIKRNSKYSNEQKKFMINQELGDATINILSYFILTMPLKMFSSKLVSTGKVIPTSMRNLIIRKGNGKKLGKVNFNIKDLPYFSGIEKPYNSFNNFMSTSATVLGGTVASNIITPILRNRFAAHRQNAPMPLQVSSTPATTPNNRIISSFEKFKIQNKLKV